MRLFNGFAATVVLVGLAMGAVAAAVLMDLRLQECKRERNYYKLYGDIEAGMLHTSVEKMIGREGELAVGKEWPDTLGGLPQYRYGCPASFLLKSSGALETVTYNPDNPITWLKWTYPANQGERWIAIAILGKHYPGKASLVVAKRRSSD